MLTQYEINKIVDAVDKKIGNKDELMNVNKVAEMLGISPDAVRTRCSRGTIPCHRRHGTLYFSKNEVTEYYLNDNTACRETR